MAWVRIDDHFDEHPKMAKAGPLGWALWMAGLAYCNRNLTDGFVPWTVARKLVSWDFIEETDDGREKIVKIGVTCGMQGDDVTSDYVIDRLVDAGLWRQIPGGFLIHDYDKYQPTKAQIEAEREAKRRAGAAGGRATATARATAPATAESEQGESARSTDSVAESQPNPNPNPNPNSVPTPVTESFAPTERGETPPSKARKANENNRSWSVWERFCTVIDADPATHPGKGRAMGVIAGLLEKGYTPEDIIGCARWLKADAFDSKRLDLVRVRQRIDGYLNAGRPGVPDAEMDDDEVAAYLRGPIINGQPYGRTAD